MRWDLNTHHVFTPDFTEVIFPCLKDTAWDFWFSGFYIEFMPVGLLLPNDGWKLRANAATVEEAIRILEIIVPICVDRRLAFKVLGDPSIYTYAHSKKMMASSAGKFFTCYLPDERALVEVADLFDQALSREGLSPAAEPISDQRLSPSLSYRFGSFTGDALVRGVADCRDYFKLPDDVTDPFTGECGAEAEVDSSGGVTIGDYCIETLLHRTFASSVYRGTRTRGEEEKSIILKQARAYATVEGIAATTRLENEYLILKAIADKTDCAGICPIPLQLFQMEGHGFLAMTEIDAVSLYEWMQQQKQNWREYLWISIEVAKLISKIHTHGGVSWRDLNPANFLIDTVKRKLYLVDAEFAVMPASVKDFALDLQMLGKLLLWLAFSGESDEIWEYDSRPEIFLEKLKKQDSDDKNAYYWDAVDFALSPEAVDVRPILKMLTRLT